MKVYYDLDEPVYTFSVSKFKFWNKKPSKIHSFRKLKKWFNRYEREHHLGYNRDMILDDGWEIFALVLDCKLILHKGKIMLRYKGNIISCSCKNNKDTEQ